jgi:hypothetical protein
MVNDKQLKQIVEKILSEDPLCRENNPYANKLLTYKVMRHYTGIFIPFKDFEKIPSFESIARCKRDIQHKENKLNNNKFIPDPNIIYEKKKSES